MNSTLKQSHDETSTRKKAHDFFKLYKTKEETSAILKKFKNADAENISTNKSIESSKRDKSFAKQKYKEPKISQTIDSQKGKATSTPLTKEKYEKLDVKPIIKKGFDDSSLDTSNMDSKRKKRNKSVSFQLDDNEVIANKKSKTDIDSSSEVPSRKSSKKNKSKFTKLKNKEIEKENFSNMQMEVNHTQDDNDTEIKLSPKNMKIFTNKNKINSKTKDITQYQDIPTTNVIIEKRKKKSKKEKEIILTEPSSIESNHDDKIKKDNEKYKKKRRQKKKKKHMQNETTKEIKIEGKLSDEVIPEVITDNLENLTIGDNPHTLTNLLDEMKVVDKINKKKSKGKLKLGNNKIEPLNPFNTDTAELEHIEEGKEKVIWNKSRWNKGNKIETNTNILTSVIVENLPFNIIIDYKKKLQDHFSKLGLIKFIGPVELYPTEDTKPLFTTTIHFYSEGSATQALEEDNTIFEGNRIRVKRPLPPTQTTLVVHSYGELTEQGLSSIFLGAGRIRNIRFLIKGKKSICTAFVEFDGPEAVEKAISMAAEAKIGGKKIHVSKFEQRQSKKPRPQNSNFSQNNEKMSED